MFTYIRDLLQAAQESGTLWLYRIQGEPVPVWSTIKEHHISWKYEWDKQALRPGQWNKPVLEIWFQISGYQAKGRRTRKKKTRRRKRKRNEDELPSMTAVFSKKDSLGRNFYCWHYSLKQGLCIVLASFVSTQLELSQKKELQLRKCLHDIQL